MPPMGWVNACVCKGYSHFSEEHVVGVIGGGESLQVSLQLQQLPLHLPEALFQILCRHWHTPTYTESHTHIRNSTQKRTHVPRKCEERSRERERTTQLQVQSNSLLFWGSERIREKHPHKKITGKNEREKPAQLQSVVIVGSHCARNTMGINNDWGKNKHQVKVRSIHSFLLFSLRLKCSCVS